jgi:hypothetical protein
VLATIIGLAANLVPLAGVWFWGWDAFQVLIIYWAETLVIGGWALARIATLPPQYLGKITINGREKPGTNKTMTWFFAANAGGFIFAHLVFLCVLFFKDWPGTVQGPTSFITEYFGHAGMWSVLLLTFLSGLASFVTATPRPMILDNFDLRWHPQRSVPAASNKTKGNAASKKTRGNVDYVGVIIADLYKRILVMQVGIIAGAWFAQSYGTRAPLLIVIVLKTLIDLGSSGGSSFPMTVSTNGTTVSIKPSDPAS